MTFSKFAAPLSRRGWRSHRNPKLSDFFYSEPPRSKFSTHKPSFLLVARPISRPQLPFLYPASRANTAQAQIGRYISTERQQRWKEQFWRYVRFNAYLWPTALLLTVLAIGIQHTKLERDFPTPPEWTLWTRWRMREAKFTEFSDDAKIQHILTDWAKVGRLYLNVLERLESEEYDGKFLIKEEVTGLSEDVSSFTGFDISAKSEQWRRGYHEALMGAGRAAEHLEGMCKRKGETRGRVYPRESIPGPDNPRPKPLPWNKKDGKEIPPSFSEVEDAFASPESFYMKVLTTGGFDTRQRLEAALAYADLCDFRKMPETAESTYIWALEIAQLGLPGGTGDVVDLKTGVILKERENAVSENVLKACTALGVHHARNEGVKHALPIFLSVLRARKNLPASPVGVIGTTPKPAKPVDGGLLAYVEALKDLIIERPYPAPPPTGNERPFHTLKEACEEVGLMTYIGEILFATSESERVKGLSWTRDSVEAAEAIMWVMDEQKQQDGRERCRECLETGLLNWKAMSQQMARLAAQKEQDLETDKGFLGLGLGRSQQIAKAQAEIKKWDEENAQIELRRQKTLPLIQDQLKSVTVSWLPKRA